MKKLNLNDLDKVIGGIIIAHYEYQKIKTEWKKILVYSVYEDLSETLVAKFTNKKQAIEFAKKNHINSNYNYKIE